MAEQPKTRLIPVWVVWDRSHRERAVFDFASDTYTFPSGYQVTGQMLVSWLVGVEPDLSARGR